MRLQGATASILGTPLLLLSFLGPAYADIIAANAQSPPGIGVSSGGGIGQSVTTAALGGPWDNIIFHWLDVSGQPTAFGTLFLLSQEYLSTPAALNSSTPGYIAEAAASGEQYPFAASLSLQPNFQYFFYTNSVEEAAGNSGYTGGDLYGSVPPSDAFLNGEPLDFHFFLLGTPVQNGTPPPIPEPASLILIGIGIGALAAWRRMTR